MENSINDRAFLRAIAQDYSATEVTPAQVRDAADGMAGHRRDGVVDATERTAFIALLYRGDVSARTRACLERAFVGGTRSIRVPAAAKATRFAPYFDLATARLTNVSAGVWTFNDARDHMMQVAADPRVHHRLSATFAQAHTDVAEMPAIKLNRGELEVLANRLARIQLDLTKSPDAGGNVAGLLDAIFAKNPIDGLTGGRVSLGNSGFVTAMLQAHANHRRSLGRSISCDSRAEERAMSEQAPLVARINPSDTAFLRAIAGDNAKVVTTAQARKAADGLAGHSKDGYVDMIEQATLLGVADNSNVTGYSQEKLALLISGRISKLAIEQRPQSRGRIPGYLDVPSLYRNSSGGDFGTYIDRRGHTMVLWMDSQSPSGLAASFAPSPGDATKAPRLKLTPAEADTLAPQLVRQELANATVAPRHRDILPDVDTRLKTTKPLQGASDERNLLGADELGRLHVDGRYGVYILRLTDVIDAKLLWAEGDPNLEIQYRESQNGWSQPRVITRNEAQRGPGAAQRSLRCALRLF